MIEQTIITQTRAAKMTIKLIAMTNFIPTFSAFDSSVDELEHQSLFFVFLVQKGKTKCIDRRLITFPTNRAIKKLAGRILVVE